MWQNMEKIRTKKRTLDTILNVFAWVSFFLAIIISVTVLFSNFSGTQNGKTVFGHKMLIVESDSMCKSAISKDEPISFSSGDLIIIKEVKDPSTIKVGDVISFVSYNPSSKGKTLSHKVCAVLTTATGDLIGFETYGIYTGEKDQAIVEPNTIIGKYVSKIPNFGYLFSFLKKPAGYFTSILVPCILLIIFFSIKVGKIIARREMAKSYDIDIDLLKTRLSELEKIKEGVEMQSNNGEILLTEVAAAPMDEQVEVQPDVVESQKQDVQPQQVCVQYPQTQPSINEKAIELTVNTLNRTIDTLLKTIENLAVTVEKPVDTLARTVETLANSTTKNVVHEKIVEVPVVVEQKVEEKVAPAETISPIATTIDPVKDQVVEPQAKEGSVFDKFNNMIEKVPFNKKLLSLDSEIKNYFSEVHNELISYKRVNYRISFKGVSYRVGRKTVAKIAVRGKTLKLYLALNVDDYAKTVYFQEDSSNVKKYEDVPFTLKIKSNRGKNNAIKLITSLAENNNLVKDEQFKKENILKDLKRL